MDETRIFADTRGYRVSATRAGPGRAKRGRAGTRVKITSDSSCWFIACDLDPCAYSCTGLWPVPGPAIRADPRLVFALRGPLNVGRIRRLHWQVNYPIGCSGRQNGSSAAMNSIGTSSMKDFNHSAQYFIPACSDTTWPSTINAFLFPDAI